MNLLQQTTQNQQRAASPETSAFVMANAGAGKTRVLTNRVARLLLAQTPPEKILCITFTKAAAAEMAERLFEVLGEWALMDDAALTHELQELEGLESRPRDAKALAEARQLFARALETPGGLKIQTIHSFCESVLRRFPLEAGTAPGFMVIEDGEAAALLQTSINEAAQASKNDKHLSTAFDRLANRYTALSLRELLENAINARRDFERCLSEHGSYDALTSALADSLNVDQTKKPEDIKTGFLKSLKKEEMERLHDALSASGGRPEKRAAAAHHYLKAGNTDQCWQALTQLFLTQDGKPYSQSFLVTGATKKIDPWAYDYALAQRDAFAKAHESLIKLTLFKDTTAFYTITADILTRYRAKKNARAALDFDDLIAKTQALFSNVAAEWAMYKLDYGIDHILIDEAQDTSPDQWNVIETLFKEFLSGTGARTEEQKTQDPKNQRSFFAVGDLKQSIYSFQGANAGLFKQKETDLGERLAAVTQYTNVPLELSFRTTEPVLSFVDAIYKDPAAAEGLGGSDIPQHYVHREGEAGLVELWPLTPPADEQNPNPWDAPLDSLTADDPSIKLAGRIAEKISRWLEHETLLETKNRPIRPSDILILVQSRGKLFTQIIENLGRHGVPVAGADRLKLLEDPAIEDLISYLRFIVTPADDLSLAEVLKSPLFGFYDDTDLFPLAYCRREGQSLWSALQERGHEKPLWKDTAHTISEARKAAIQTGPFGFLNHVLETGVPSGRKKFYARLGLAARDALDEMVRQALSFESSNPRSLRGFLTWFTANASEIKREMERGEEAVRIMTTHGAKGLEAEIVFLIDAHRTPNMKSDGTLKLHSNSGKPSLISLAGAQESNLEVIAEAKQIQKREAYEEYRRLFYVAATRARDQLYICGVAHKRAGNARDKNTDEKTWHALSQDAFDRLNQDFPGRVQEGDEPFWPDTTSTERSRWFGSTQTKPPKEEDTTTLPIMEAVPACLFETASPETKPARPSPAQLALKKEATAESPAQSAAYSPISLPDPYFRGRLIHRLLELLPELDKNEREGAASRFLAHAAPMIPEREREIWCQEVLVLMTNPQFSHVFAKGSRAEVSIGGILPQDPYGRIISGQIDRLIIEDDQITIVDYKTNRPPPDDPADAPLEYIAQLAAYRALLHELYPNHQITCALLWTFVPNLMTIPTSTLDHAFARMLEKP